MQVVLIKKDKIINLNLPENVSGNYWITDFDNGKKMNLINIEEQNGSWTLISNNDIYICNSEKVLVPSAKLSEYNFYLINNSIKNEQFYIYCCPTIDPTFMEYAIATDSEVIIGSDENSSICCKMGGIPKKAFSIAKSGNNYYLTLLDNNTTVYVNQKRVLNKKRLDYGDGVFIFGLKIILLRKDGRDYLLVNNPRKTIDYNASFTNINRVESSFNDDNAELNIDTNYEEDDYFYRIPYFYKKLSTYEINIDAPTPKKDEKQNSMILTIGPMLTMSMTSIVSLISSVNSFSSGGDKSSSIKSMVICLAMLASTILWPIVTNIFQKSSDRKNEHKRQKSYKNYIKKKEKEILDALEEQRQSLINNNFSIEDCKKIILTHDERLWQRRITDEDFLTIPLGYGNLKMDYKINYPEEHFSLEEDNLLDLARNLGKEERILNDVPILYSFYENPSTGIIGNYVYDKDFIDRILLQMMAYYSYDELKFITLTTTDRETGWDYMKVLPHSWSNDRSFRYFGSNNDDYREIIYEVEKIYNERSQTNTTENAPKISPHYVIIIDAIKSVDSYDILKKIMTDGKKLGFSIIILVDKITALPNECKSFINVNKDECDVFKNELNSQKQLFKIDYTSYENPYDYASELANIPILIQSQTDVALPNVYKFLEMFQVGKVEQLNVSERWKKSNPILSLQAPIGIGKSGDIINLDLHEKYHGPHGLIAGTTGSGKSEFIITYILSLAINYHPNEVQFILIDYKGGGLAGAFTNDAYRLPHLAGVITNLDGNELNRSLTSIESEVKRRQAAFNEARKITNESNIDIYKYQKLWREGRLEGKEPISHLFIISDEFAELKEQQPEFMEKLISVARVGRSLGVHLILATQKPGGVVDAQIWSNTRFRVCLKVQDTSDSQEVLKKPDAAFLKQTGRFYLQVGYDEVYTLGQSAWAGSQYFPSNALKKDVNTKINLINNIGFTITTKDTKDNSKVESQGEELPNIVKYLSSVANSENIQVHKLWIEKIPAKIYIDNLYTKYKFEKNNYIINPIIGEYDDPVNQNQFALRLPISNNGNVAIYGVPGSGKENFIFASLYSIMKIYSPEEVNFYIMDFASETLKVFNSNPFVGDIILLNEKEKVQNFFKLITDELEKRKKLFAQYGGSFSSYNENSGEKLPNIINVINGYENFVDSYEDYQEQFEKITRECFKYGIYFMLAINDSNALRNRIKQNFSLVYALKQADEYDYQMLIGSNQKIVPTDIIGRGVFKNGGTYEFQTALIAEDNVNEYIKKFNEELKNKYQYKAKRIPILPEVVNFEYIKDYIQNDSKPIIGVNSNTLNTETFNLRNNPVNLLLSVDTDDEYNFINCLASEIIYQKYYDLFIFNGTEHSFKDPVLSQKTYDKNYDSILEKMFKYVSDIYDAYQKNNYNLSIVNNQKKFVIFIYGINDFMNKLKSETKTKLNEFMKQNAQINVVSFVIADTPDILKNYQFEDWFKTGADLTKGIWIGSGIDEQNVIKVSKLSHEDRAEIPKEYGYVINNSKIKRIKLLTEFKNNN